VFYTDRQVEVLEFLRDFRQQRSVSPTLEEMAQHFRVSKVTIHGHLNQLEGKKAILRVPHQARAIEILDPDYRSDGRTAEEGSVTVEILGSIAAGEPIEAKLVEKIDLGDLMPMGRDHYALRVKGDSMIDDGIHDGDLVIVENRTDARDGELVVAIVEDEEATLKKLFREVHDGRRMIRLQPANSSYQPRFFDEVEVRGVVVGVVRKYPAWKA